MSEHIRLDLPGGYILDVEVKPDWCLDVVSPRVMLPGAASAPRDYLAMARPGTTFTLTFTTANVEHPYTVTKLQVPQRGDWLTMPNEGGRGIVQGVAGSGPNGWLIFTDSDPSQMVEVHDTPITLDPRRTWQGICIYP